MSSANKLLMFYFFGDCKHLFEESKTNQASQKFLVDNNLTYLSKTLDNFVDKVSNTLRESFNNLDDDSLIRKGCLCVDIHDCCDETWVQYLNIKFACDHCSNVLFFMENDKVVEYSSGLSDDVLKLIKKSCEYTNTFE
jgi:hypothetical protein